MNDDELEPIEYNDKHSTYHAIGCLALVASAVVVIALIALIGWAVQMVLS